MPRPLNPKKERIKVPESGKGLFAQYLIILSNLERKPKRLLMAQRHELPTI